MASDPLTREALVAAARESGVERPEVMTRDELLVALRVGHAAIESEAPRSWFGIARDLIASVVEQGLHLPDAARLIRAVPAPPARRRPPPAPLATVTLAEIFAAQGHQARALEVLDSVLAGEPQHAAALALRARLLSGRAPRSVPPPPPAVPAGPVEAAVPAPRPPLVSAPPPVALPPQLELRVEPGGAWTARWSLGGARARADARAVLRTVELAPSWSGARATLRDHPLDGAAGALAGGPLGPGAELCAALGWLDGRAFQPIAVARRPQD